MNNRLYNCKNPYQGKARRVLCVCSAGLLRSPTAAIVLQREYGHNTRSCGCSDYALIPLDEVLLEWADEILIMNAYMISSIDKKYHNKVACLHIPDIFEYMNEELQQLIKDKYGELK